MDYEAIKKEIKALIEEARQTPHGRVEGVLEPLREAMIEARHEGVKLVRLFKKLEAEGVKISASSFAKYAQKHLRVKKAKGSHRAKPPAKPKVTQSIKHENVKTETTTESAKPTPRKPRIATGNY